MELEVLNGAIKGWEGADISTLGEIHYMNGVLTSTTTTSSSTLGNQNFKWTLIMIHK